MIKAWMNGVFSSDDKDAMIAEFCTEDVVIDARMFASNTDMYTTYKGHVGVREWNKRLNEIDFLGLRVLHCGVLPSGNVVTKWESLPLVKVTGKAASSKVSDIAKWTLVDGKIKDCRYYWGSSRGMNELFQKT